MKIKKHRFGKVQLLLYFLFFSVAAVSAQYCATMVFPGVFNSKYICSEKNEFEAKTVRVRNNKGDIDSFVKQFDLFNNNKFDKSFFNVRKKRNTELFSPEINKMEYSSFLSCIKLCDCNTDEIYYKPCYYVETENFIILAISTACDTSINGYPFESNILITYDKIGNFIDYEVIGCISDISYYKIEESIGFSELVYVQYSFFDTDEIYSGKCDVEIYRVVINDKGAIDKTLLDDYKDDITIVL